MNLFLIGFSPSGEVDPRDAAGCVAGLLARLPFFGSRPVETWHAPSRALAVAWVDHEAERVGGIRYVDWDRDGIALFSGRPFRWNGEEGADGSAALDARFYRRPIGEWMDALDGRCVAARYAEPEGSLELYADPLGAYPLYAGAANGTRWISNSPELVRSAIGSHDVDERVLASVLATGWSLPGQPVWARVRRLAPGAAYVLPARGPDRKAELLSLERIAALPGAGLDVNRATRDLVAATGALSQWPGRPNVLQLSGGLDSRLVFAAAREAEAQFQVVTVGTPDVADVRVAREICARAGLDHQLLSSDPGASLHEGTVNAARVLALTSGLAMSMEHASGYPFAATEGPLPLWLNGQAGDMARAYYGSADGMDRDALVSRLLRAEASGIELLAPAARQTVRDEIARAVDEIRDAGAALGDVLDVFYLVRRTAFWAAVGHGCCEYAKGDTTAPLWSWRVVAHELAPARAQRAEGAFHRATLAALDPDLDRLPLAEWEPLHRPGADRFAPVLAQVREAARAQADHPVWQVLDRSYVGELLSRDHRALDFEANRHVWRLATMFLSDAWDGGA